MKRKNSKVTTLQLTIALAIAGRDVVIMGINSALAYVQADVSNETFVLNFVKYFQSAAAPDGTLSNALPSLMHHVSGNPSYSRRIDFQS